ncbi:MAG: glutamate--tRNA ligase [bacterium]|nr:glutamate--tRNA ligase [bacterium]
MNVRVRMAPSPTGNLHIGTARTALFNWLYAKKYGGKLVLRIEDTDTERSKPEFEKDIIEQLTWLGLTWDEGPFRQSERLHIYEGYLRQLLTNGHAYWCDCTKENLEVKRKNMMEAGIAPKYDGHCRDKKIQEGPSAVIRFVMPERVFAFKDLVRGKIEFNMALTGDIVIAKSLRAPLYNFAVVVDDHEMAISHVIRGEDGLANTPKQLALQETLGFNHPHYAHIPLILDADRAKMSKRNAATALKEYAEAGYVPEAMVNFLALMGWHPEDNRETFTPAELAEVFTIERVQKAGAVFAIEKLNWMNAHYIKNMADKDIASRIGWEPTDMNMKIIALIKNRAQTLNDFATHGAVFFNLPEYDAALLAWKEMKPEEIIESLKRCADAISIGRTADIPALAEKYGKGETYWPLRVALSGQKESPSPMDLIHILGREESLKRIERALLKVTPNDRN